MLLTPAMVAGQLERAHHRGDRTTRDGNRTGMKRQRTRRSRKTPTPRRPVEDGEPVALEDVERAVRKAVKAKA